MFCTRPINDYHRRLLQARIVALLLMLNVERVSVKIYCFNILIAVVLSSWSIRV